MAGAISAEPGVALIDAAGTRHAPAAGAVRIVSLVPSLTELLFALGLGEKVVGRTGFCIHPAPQVKAVPKLGGTKDVAVERLLALAPTHVIVNVDENLKEAAELLAAQVPHLVVTHPLAPDDNLPLYRLFGGIFNCQQRAEELAADYVAARDRLRVAVAGLPRLKALYLIWRDPWMTVARSTYIAAMLAEAGIDTLPVFCEPRYPAIALPGAESGAADLILLSSEPYRFLPKHVAEIAALSGRATHLIDGEMTSWYGSRAIEGFGYLAEFRRRLAAGGTAS